MEKLTQKAKICFIAGGVCLVIGLITSGPLWYIGLLVLGIIGFLDVYKRVDKKDEGQPALNENDLMDCPFCAEKIQKNAKICRFCNKEIT